MPDPLKKFSELQTAWTAAWTESANTTIQFWQHMFELQRKMLETGGKYQRSRVEIADGASLTDKYGKRQHDIDPEHDV